MSETDERLRLALADRYRLERELGQGGMATVYLAEDLKHDRKVAIKVLKPELAAVIGAERFLREIKTIAGLQHPHILGLLDSGELDGTAFYVMPFVEGESLRDRLGREKQLPITEAVRIATEVASALDYAHRRGVIHRDIKPENILLHDGRALVADFGIALAASKAGGTRMTETGMSLGTPTYMSPEQAMGEREITAKSDVYALGCVLYEMLVGEPPFTGPTAQAIVAKVMTDEPRPPRQLRKTVPAALEGVVLMALAKLPADRFASAAAVVDALGQSRFESGQVATMAIPIAAGPARTRGVARAAAWIAVGALAGVLLARPWRPAAAAGSMERRQATYSGRAVAPTISADGRFLAYLETRCPEPPGRGGCVSLQVAEVGSARPVEVITGADRLGRPRWTHDGLGLVVGGALGAGRSGLFAIPRLGGSPRRLADEPLAYAVHPSADSLALVVAGDSGAALQVVDLASGQAIGRAVALPLAPLDIDWSPDGRRFALSGYDQLHVVRRDGVPLSSLGRTGTRAPLRWSADGRHLLTFRWSAGQDDDLMAYPVADDGRLGAPRLLISQMPTLLRGEFDVARAAGRLVVGSGAEFSDVWLFDLEPASLRSRRLTQGTSWYGPPVLTSDGRTVYYLRADPLGNSLYSNVDGRETALTAERQVVNSSLRLSPDERAVVFESSVDTSLVLMIHDIATGASRRVPRTTQAMGWLLPGGREIAWADHSTRSVWLTDAEGGNRREVSVRLADDAADGNPGWSALRGGRWLLAPDGESLAILLTGRGEAQLVEVPLHGGQPTRLGRFMLSDGDIGLSAWSRTGMIHLARRHPDAGRTVLLQLDPATGDVRPHAEMDRPCAPLSVSYAPAARRAACTVNEVRADLMLIDGLRP